MNRHAIVSTRIGDLTLVASDNALAGVYFPHHWVKPTPETLGEQVEATDPLLSEAARQLDAYLAGERTGFDIPTVLRGDEFQRRVWSILEEIPYGATSSYGEIAERLGDRTLAQQVGKAVGQNPLSIVVPCHRVVGKNGSLTGYAGGLKRKQFLLDLEEPVGVRLF
ncbi:methylated-DNA--[protein]-cysteine S-methyltransferase [Kribbella capetownensis]|uniref:Methylated-DNA--protein-cysteine methyltransferase n=1 Tax=Kribbella capetownensis TaxID=1572659 RepID=A0A4R0JYM1_9ACTN|nr:methylated-DNA--[protein]-cysteine S-methyltransferase [Kribbella capetownensis]TCC52681.1 methylated-DNA--[protein]-cysteine S-methyltransferase [Kribbella capetownensis]